MQKQFIVILASLLFCATCFVSANPVASIEGLSNPFKLLIHSVYLFFAMLHACAAVNSMHVDVKHAVVFHAMVRTGN